MQRNIQTPLREWKASPSRRVLLLRGARQVGKTFSVRELGKTFDHFIEVNFERDFAVRPFFDGTIDPSAICEKLAVYARTPVIPGKTLLFFDELQAFPVALHALRFFHESIPDLHLIGAGSLLEFALSEIPSQGVGRLTSLYMYPMCFSEFLEALGEWRLAKAIAGAVAGGEPLDDVFHRRSLDLARWHMLIGGMPAVVGEFAQCRDALACQKTLDDLLQFLRDDFAKYRTRVASTKLDETLLSVARQSGGKFRYTETAGTAPIAGYREALGLLAKAGLVHRVCHSSARGMPLGAQKDDKKFKAFALDTGLHQRMLNLDISDLIARSPGRLVNEGSLAEVYVGIELISGMPSHLRPELYYWHREAKTSHAEVDYLFGRGGRIVPVEVKSSGKGAMKSMHLFLDEGHAPRGMRLSQENFGSVDRIDIAPFYAASWVPSGGAMSELIANDSPAQSHPR